MFLDMWIHISISILKTCEKLKVDWMYMLVVVNPTTKNGFMHVNILCCSSKCQIKEGKKYNIKQNYTLRGLNNVQGEYFKSRSYLIISYEHDGYIFRFNYKVFSFFL